MKTSSVNLGSAGGSVKPPPLITLTSDFGLADPFVGIMKGVILSLCPIARIVDLTHQVPPQDILAGYLALESAYPYFPPRTIHVAVVDPGVGSARQALWARTARGQFIAPDNGLLSFLAPDRIEEMRFLTDPEFRLETVSQTFHGRDVFAPAAAHLARGVHPGSLGPLTTSMVRVPVPEPEIGPSSSRGVILAFDHFGNAVTNLRERHLPGPSPRVGVAGGHIPLAAAYSEVPPGSPLAICGSTGRLEISVRNGDARALLGLARGDPVEVYNA